MLSTYVRLAKHILKAPTAQMTKLQICYLNQGCIRNLTYSHVWAYIKFRELPCSGYYIGESEQMTNIILQQNSHSAELRGKMSARLFESSW